VKVLIVDDHLLFAEAIQFALSDEGVGDVSVAADAGEALLVLGDDDSRPEVVLMDMRLPDRSGISLGAEIVERWPSVRVIALTAFKNRALMREAIHAGFHGFLTKDSHVSRVVNAVNVVRDGEMVVPRSLARAPSRRNDDDAALLAAQLTDRERQVLARLAEGSASPEIARKLGISPNTVRTHVQSILAKLGVHSRLEAAAFAVRHGLVSSPSRPV
jgi:two-component system, NarL family, nitrate/nitrite response regulator NarL